jgi:hypothetical protein
MAIGHNSSQPRANPARQKIQMRTDVCIIA